MSNFSALDSAIVRFFDAQGYVVGAGFLVSPQYVLTCAHVVQEALGKTEQSLEETPFPLETETLELDFSIVAEDKKLKAKVVLWQPKNDIAGLKLASKAPSKCRAFELNPELKYEGNEVHSCRVFGFAYSDKGRWLNCYEIIGRVSGGQFQLEANKTEDGNIIKGGFSGAPVWNNNLRGVVGMVAEAGNERNNFKVAFAVPLEKLVSAVEQLEIQEILSPHWDKLKSIIKDAYSFCRPAGWIDEPLASNLANVLENLSKMPEGEEGYDRILKFVAFLIAERNSIPEPIRDQMRKWLKSKVNNFDEIFNCFLQERESGRQPSPTGQSYLMVLLEPKSSQGNCYFVKAWLIADSDRYHAETDTGIKQLFLPEEWGETFTIGRVSQILDSFLEQASQFPLGDLTIELFLPIDLLNHEVDRWTVEDFGSATPIGCSYPVVVRSYDRCQPNYRYRRQWQRRWTQLKEVAALPASDYFVEGNGDRLNKLFAQIERQPEKVGLKIAHAPRKTGKGSIFSVILKTGIPVALWLRSCLQEINCQEEIDRVLGCTTSNIPDSVRDTRLEALELEDDQNEVEHIGHHLSLLWEDPNRLPPRTM